ncbi:hypothetical protein ACHAWX_002005 [Stephanocyclus meneghinianus]
MNSLGSSMTVGGAIVVIAKCPISGVSKTRCAPLLGYDGAASLAKAMLSDILVTLSECVSTLPSDWIISFITSRDAYSIDDSQYLLRKTLKVLMYAPGTTAGESNMISILRSLKLLYYSTDSYPINDCIAQTIFETHDTERWYLLPMIPTPEANSMSAHLSLERDLKDLNSSALGDKLIDALERTRILLAQHKGHYQQNEAVLFLGMDAPELPIEEIIYGLQVSSGIPIANQHDGFDETEQKYRGRAHLCPAADGGFGLLSVPIHAPSSIFTGVRWSNSLTAVSQLKALTDAGVDVSVGKLMFDVDDPSDVRELASRLLRTSQSSDANQRKDILSQFASGIASTPADCTCIGKKCQFTLQTLIEFGIIDKTRLH